MSYITVHRTYCSPCYKNFIKNSQWTDHQEYVPRVHEHQWTDQQIIILINNILTNPDSRSRRTCHDSLFIVIM